MGLLKEGGFPVKSFKLILFLWACLGGALAASAQIYDARTDFSSTQNPNGVWTYGWSADLSGPLHVYKDLFTKGGGFDWTDNAILDLGDPHVALYPRDVPDGYVPPHSVLMHPGPRNQFSHCVWKAPAAGFYDIHASFTSLCTGGPHGYVLKNGVSIGDSLLDNGTPWACSFNSVSLAAGDTIEAVVGVGTNGTFFNDETQFSLTITGKESGAPGGDTAPARQLDSALRALIREELRNMAAPENSPHARAGERQGVVSPVATSGQTYDAYADFSPTKNPSGAWTYGWSADLGGPLHVYENAFLRNSVQDWGDAAIESAGAPIVGHNPFDVETGDVPARSMASHPGPGNEFSNCVWNAPAAGVYDIQASFTALSTGGPHGYVLKNGASIGDSILENGKPWAAGFNSVPLAAGDTIDAAVGVGNDRTFQNDLTQFSLTIKRKEVGEPATEGGLETALQSVIREELRKAPGGHAADSFPVDAASWIWQNSGVWVTAGQHVLVEAAPADTWNTGWGPINANGYMERPKIEGIETGTPVFQTGVPFKDWHWGALICAVGNSRDAIKNPQRQVEVGLRRGFTVDCDGYLYFICNDDPRDAAGRNEYDDNSGIIHVKVTVTNPPISATAKSAGGGQ